MQEILRNFGAGAIALTACYPLESINKQFHVTSSTEHTSRTLIKENWRAGGIRGFYRGLGPALLTFPSYWAVYMPVYKQLKKHVDGSTFAVHASISWIAGAIGVVATNPLWVLRQRQQTEVVKCSRDPLRPRATYANVFRSLWTEGGVRAFYRGTGLTMVKNVQMGFLFPVFERLQKRAPEGALYTALAAGTAKLSSSLMVYPLDVVRTNMRFREGNNTNAGWRLTVKELISRPGGLRNLFRGVGWYCASTSSMFAVMMTIAFHV